MYICICHALPEGKIKEAHQAGARTVKEVFAHYGVTAKCGTCAPDMKKLLDELTKTLPKE